MNIYIQLAYLISSVLFIIGIKLMNRTKDARRGNLVSAAGMMVAILATLVQIQSITFIEIMVCIVIGSAIGLVFATRVEMTQIPEMVALFNGFGGLASVAVALSDYWLRTQVQATGVDVIVGTSAVLSIFIGGVTFTGSMVAFLKLNGKISGKPITFTAQHLLNLALFIGVIGVSILAIVDQYNVNHVLVVTAIALLLGILTVIPIGGADMPVVISLLNSY